MVYQTTYQSPIGQLTLASDGTNLIGLWIEGQKYFGGSVKEEMQTLDTIPVFSLTKNWLDRYFSGKNPKIAELSLAPRGSEFRQRVWKLLCQIPYGQVTTYGALARQLAAAGNGFDDSKSDGKSGTAFCTGMSAQAVGGAVGHNPISIIIPCHRVVGADGSLTGYAGGIEKKSALLELEKAYVTGLKR